MRASRRIARLHGSRTLPVHHGCFPRPTPPPDDHDGRAPGAAGEIVEGAQQAGLNIAGKKYMPNQLAGMAMQAAEGNWQNPMKQLGQGFIQQGTLPTNAFSITNPNVGKPSGPTYQPFDPNSMLTNPFQQPSE